MCPSKRILHQSKNGIITYCKQSNLFQLVYNNLCFELYEWELDVLKEHILNIDITYWEEQLKCAVNQRKIPLSVGTKHFIILFKKSELAELKTLLNKSLKEVPLLSYKDIEYTYLEN